MPTAPERISKTRHHEALQTLTAGDEDNALHEAVGRWAALISLSESEIRIEMTCPRAYGSNTGSSSERWSWPDEVEALVDEWRTKTAGRRTAQRGTFTKDRERPNTFIQIVEFPSYEDAMANSDLPETASFAQRLGQLCEGPMLFRNLDVRRVEEM
jgi:hypothetical protein